ncbi:iron chaperone [Nocardia carnea]|uniref:iron chaperone n=1 Tax=Nocardia carnea TaxID=37328 RepID=UPI0024589AD6|nr:DUF1801 domain-containing protein [Nocardia carnea]
MPVVKSTAADVDTYLAGLPDDRRAHATVLRDLCRTELTSYSEVMAYGMPNYQYSGKSEIAFAVQRNYLSFYLMREDVREAFAPRLAGQDTGKGCLRFRGSAGPDVELVRDLLRAVAAEPGGRVC